VRPLQRLSTAWLAALLLLACAPSVAPTPDSGQPPTPGPPPGTPALASPIVEPSPAIPTGVPPTGDPTAPAVSPEPTHIEGASWTYLSDFPVGEALAVNAVAATAAGFVAVGYEPAPGEGPDGIRQGVVWTTQDGLSWERASDAAFAGASLDSVAVLNDEVFVFGYVSTCPAFDEDCPSLADSGNAGWRLAADGSWSALTLLPAMRGAVIEGVTVALDRLVVRGTIGEEEVEQALWLSRDGESWTAQTDLAGIGFVSELIDAAGAIVGLGTTYDFESDTISTRAIYSADGTAFRQAEVPSGLQAAIDGLAHGPAGLVAVGSSVPADPPEAGAVVMRSDDGQRWSAEQPAELAGHEAVAVHTLAGEYVVIGTQSLTDAGEPYAGVAWSSPDGLAWQPIAPFNDAPFSELTASTAGRPGIVLFAITLSDDRPVLHAWLGSVDLLEAP
jgi:hypothetical protein